MGSAKDDDEHKQYQPKDAVDATLKGTMITGAAGVVSSAIQNSLAKQNVGPWGVVTRTGGTIAIFGKS
jgi:delta 1-pyrroline-5-carboxylate dehydrogenase